MEKKLKRKNLRWPGVEPGSTAWKATMLTVTPPTLHIYPDYSFLGSFLSGSEDLQSKRELLDAVQGLLSVPNTPYPELDHTQEVNKHTITNRQVYSMFSVCNCL